MSHHLREICEKKNSQSGQEYSLNNIRYFFKTTTVQNAKNFSKTTDCLRYVPVESCGESNTEKLFAARDKEGNGQRMKVKSRPEGKKSVGASTGGFLRVLFARWSQPPPPTPPAAREIRFSRGCYAHGTRVYTRVSTVH